MNDSAEFLREPDHVVSPGELTELLDDIEPGVLALVKEHEGRRTLWMPSELVPKDAELGSLSPEDALAYGLGLVTEKGLPSFHDVLLNSSRSEGVWPYWANLWTAEEARHEVALMRCLMKLDSGIDLPQFERLQHLYLCAGWRPKWRGDIFALLAYTSPQERATQISHANLAGRVKATTSGVAKVLGGVAGDELWHERYYTNVLKLLYARRPAPVLHSLMQSFTSFEMPGASMPGFENLSYVAQRLGIFTTWDFKKIVEEIIEKLELEAATGLDAVSSKTLKRILKLPTALVRRADRFDKSEKRTLEFPFLPGRKVEL